jgi:hypothetical protein
MAYEIIVTVLLVVFGFLSAYFKTKSEVKIATSKLINIAERKYSSGTTKFAYVVDSLYKLVPAPLKFILTKEIISTIVQSTFNQMEAYAVKQMDKVVDKVTDKVEESLSDKK